MTKKVSIKKLHNGDIELRSTDFEALQEEKEKYLSKTRLNPVTGCPSECKKWGTHFHHKKKYRIYEVKESWAFRKPELGETIEFIIQLKKP